MSKQLTIQTRDYTYYFTLKIGFLGLCVSFFILMCALGVWQIHRYHFKQSLQETYLKQQALPPVNFQELNTETLSKLQFQKISVQGEYLNQQNIFLQNQFHGNQVGYDVLTPLQIPGTKKLLLVDRGWVSDYGNPNTPPKVTSQPGIQQVVGDLKLENEFQFILGKNILRPNVKPIVIQKVNFKELNDITHETFFPFYVRLSKESANGFVREWIITTVSPQRHLGYAIQWFLMAGILVIAYLATAIRREKKHANSN